MIYEHSRFRRIGSCSQKSAWALCSVLQHVNDNQRYFWSFHDQTRKTSYVMQHRLSFQMIFLNTSSLTELYKVYRHHEFEVKPELILYELNNKCLCSLCSISLFFFPWHFNYQLSVEECLTQHFLMFECVMLCRVFFNNHVIKTFFYSLSSPLLT